MMMEFTINEITPKSEEYFRKKCGFNPKTKNLEKKLNSCEEIRKKYFDNSSIKILIKPFSKNHIIKNAFTFDDNRIPCNVLNRIDPNSILGGYMYIFSAPGADLSDVEILEMFYADTWQTAFIDAARDKLYEEISALAKKEYGDGICLSDSFGPGFYGIGSETLPCFYRYIGGADADITLTSYGMMKPLKSILGMFLVLNQPSNLPPRDCSSCLADSKGCEFCKNAPPSPLRAN